MKIKDLTPEIVKNAINNSHNYATLSNILGLSKQHRTNKILKQYCKMNSIDVPENFERSSSKIFIMSRVELQNLVDNSDSYSDILRKLEMRVAGGNLITLKRALLNYEISSEKLDNNRTLLRKTNKTNVVNVYSLTYDEVISKYSFRSIRAYIKHHNIIEYKCQECGNIGIHNNKPLTLELDHIDGNRINNDIVNLRFMCPNCHSQTETYSVKNHKKV